MSKELIFRVDKIRTIDGSKDITLATDLYTKTDVDAKIAAVKTTANMNDYMTSADFDNLILTNTFDPSLYPEKPDVDPKLQLIANPNIGNTVDGHGLANQVMLVNGYLLSDSSEIKSLSSAADAADHGHIVSILYALSSVSNGDHLYFTGGNSFTSTEVRRKSFSDASDFGTYGNLQTARAHSWSVTDGDIILTGSGKDSQVSYNETIDNHSMSDNTVSAKWMDFNKRRWKANGTSNGTHALVIGGSIALTPTLDVDRLQINSVGSMADYSQLHDRLGDYCGVTTNGDMWLAFSGSVAFTGNYSSTAQSTKWKDMQVVRYYSGDTACSDGFQAIFSGGNDTSVNVQSFEIASYSDNTFGSQYGNLVNAASYRSGASGG